MGTGYAEDLHTATMKGMIMAILRWKGSVYKLIWKEFLLYLMAFYTFQALYFVLPLDWKHYYLFVVEYCQRFGSSLPVTLFLGFYVSTVTSRCFDQWCMLPWITGIALPFGSVIQGRDTKSRKYRRTVARYLNLAYVIVMTAISHPAKKRFPTFGHMKTSGLLTGNEEELLSSLNTVYLKYFMPIHWINNVCVKARKENVIKSDNELAYVISKANNFYNDLLNLTLYDYVQVPLVYTQAVTLCVYTFFFTCLLSRQDIDGRTLKVEISFPFFTFLQFFFYVGWLKVAEENLNPHGEDDSDFGTNSYIDYNFKASFVMFDEMHAEFPELCKDKHFDMNVVEIPYTVATYEKDRVMNLPGMNIVVKGVAENDMKMFMPESAKLLFEADTQKHKFGARYMKKLPPIFVKRLDDSDVPEKESDGVFKTNKID